jgi:hypothetical protein
MFGGVVCLEEWKKLMEDCELRLDIPNYNDVIN